jgi:hypothetical protein
MHGLNGGHAVALPTLRGCESFRLWQFWHESNQGLTEAKIAKIEMIHILYGLGPRYGAERGSDSILLSLMPLQAQSLRSHALGLFIKRLHFLVASLALGLQLIVAAELFECLFDGEFGRLCHGKPSYPNDGRPATPPTEIWASHQL